MLVRIFISLFIVLATTSQAAWALEPVKTARDLHLACGQAYEGFENIIYEPVERSVLIAQCYSFITATSQLIKAGTYSFEDKAQWQCANIPDELGEMSDTYVEWIARNHKLGKKPAAVAFMMAIEDKYPCGGATSD
jgi:hypothetical protein